MGNNTQEKAVVRQRKKIPTENDSKVIKEHEKDDEKKKTRTKYVNNGKKKNISFDKNRFYFILQKST